MRVTIALALMACAAPVCAQTPAPAANPFMGPVKTTPIRDGLTMLSAGSNAVLAVGKDKAILVDTLFFNADKLASAVQAITPKPVTMVINTHAHRDHTGGNALFAGQGARVIATSAAARRIAEPSTNPRGEVQPPSTKPVGPPSPMTRPPPWPSRAKACASSRWNARTWMATRWCGSRRPGSW
jgi:glyoxylase-like metal-dependent hydrolase (beta-lactamase superfamily II)